MRRNRDCNFRTDCSTSSVNRRITADNRGIKIHSVQFEFVKTVNLCRLNAHLFTCGHNVFPFGIYVFILKISFCRKSAAVIEDRFEVAAVYIYFSVFYILFTRVCEKSGCDFSSRICQLVVV